MSELTKVEIIKPNRDRVRPVVICEGQGRTHQEMKDAVDVNLIVNQWRNTGTAPHVNHNAPYYGDVSVAGELQDSLNHVMEAQHAFDDLPSGVRSACDNNPVQFLEMLNDDESREELLDAGLRIEEAPTPDPDPEPTPPTPEPDPEPTPPTPTGGK